MLVLGPGVICEPCNIYACDPLRINSCVCLVSVQPGEKGSPEGERDLERERNHVSFARHLHTHHHTHLGMSYNLMSGQFDIYQGTDLLVLLICHNLAVCFEE
ncbi:hypothetical protein XENORESO_012109 [Xenotaenia resolanae]|uniref:Uncharacterized protein n=1 Tax=Xenotaenia resolanae TaxID=208358 RepID=A0ABV0W871_9TELE